MQCWSPVKTQDVMSVMSHEAQQLEPCIEVFCTRHLMKQGWGVMRKAFLASSFILRHPHMCIKGIARATWIPQVKQSSASPAPCPTNVPMVFNTSWKSSNPKKTNIDY